MRINVSLEILQHGEANEEGGLLPLDERGFVRLIRFACVILPDAIRVLFAHVLYCMAFAFAFVALLVRSAPGACVLLEVPALLLVVDHAAVLHKMSHLASTIRIVPEALGVVLANHLVLLVAALLL